MRKMPITAIALIFSIMLQSCSANPSPHDIVSALSANETSLPPGRIYYSEANEGSDGYLPSSLLSAVYGIPDGFGGIQSCAIRLSSFFHPCEFAVFLCDSPNTAHSVATFCRQRLDTLKRSALSSSSMCGMTAEEYLSYLENAVVLISGRYVSLIISSTPTSAKKAFCMAL